MNHIEKVSSYLVMVFNLLLAALPLTTIITWIFIDSAFINRLIAQGILLGPIATPEGLVDLSSVQWTTMSKAIGLAAYMTYLLPLLAGLYLLKLIFQHYHTVEIFSTANVNRYRYIGWLFLINALLIKPISGLLMVLAVTFTNTAGHRYICVSFGKSNLESLLCGVLVLFISWVMLEASKLYDEQKLTI